MVKVQAIEGGVGSRLPQGHLHGGPCINVEDNEDDARAFTVDTPYRSIVDKDGTLLAKIPDIPPRSLPVTVILDRDGRVAVQIVGPIVLGTLEDTIASVIASEA